MSLGLCAHATTLQFINRCGHPIQLVRTENEKSPVLQADLAAGNGQTTADFTSGGMNFKNGYGGKGVTLAEFSFNNKDGQDFYDISVIDGYNVAMKIQPSTGGQSLTCNSADCPDAYLYPKDDTKTHGTSTGGTFTVTFCP